MSEDTLEIVSSYSASAEKLGDAGEAVTANELRNLGFLVVRNLYLPYNGHLTEIDIVAISEFGLFIIENKNYAGVVYGSLDDRYWYVKYSILGGRKLLNPITQNNIHRSSLVSLDCIKDLVPEKYIFSPVIFNDKCKLNINGADKKVFTLSKFVEVYKGYITDREPCLSKDKVKYLYDNLKEYSDCSDFMRLLHVVTLKGG